MGWGAASQRKRSLVLQSLDFWVNFSQAEMVGKSIPTTKVHGPERTKLIHERTGGPVSSIVKICDQ
jgi:hypothetical protein